MNWKIVAAFTAGAVLASGIVYLTVRPLSSPQTQSIADVRPASEAPAAAVPGIPVPEISAPSPAPQAQPPVAPPAETLPKPAPQHARLSHTPIREKPSPMPPAVHREKLPVVARNQETITAPAPAPVPAAAPEPQPPQPAQAAPPPPPPAPVPTVVAKVTPEPEERVPHTVVLAAGTPLVVRIGETVSAAHNQVGDTFVATLAQQLVIDGFIIGERGARVIGKITQAVPAGRGGGVSHLAVELDRLSTSDGQRIAIRTDAYVKEGSGSTGGDLAKIGAGAVIGAAIGAVAGGGKGAAIGAGAGAAAGTGAVLIANGKSVEIPVESRLTFRVKDSVTLTEKLD